MSYNQQGQQGYGSYNPYGQSGNPYDPPQGNPYGQPQQPAYGHQGNYSERPDLDHHSSSRYDEEVATGGSYEMSNMNGRDPNRILNEVRNLDRAVDDTEAGMRRLRDIQAQFFDSLDQSERNPLHGQMNKIRDDTMNQLRAFVQRIRTIKSDSEADNPRNRAQVGKIDRRVRAAMNQLQQVDREYRQSMRSNFQRQYRIVRPDASDAEIQEAAESGDDQIFSSALMNTNRRGEVQDAARNVRQRHQDIQRIEREMAELAQLFNDLEVLVVQQEPAVTQIEEKGTEAAGHVAQANTELDVAVKKAKSARKKKWMCLGISLLIIIIIVVVVVVVVLVVRK